MNATATAPDVLEVAARETVLYPGPADRLYRVERGLVRLYSLDERGAGMTLRYVKPGGFFGEEALQRRPRGYFAEAAAPTAIERLSPTAIDPASERALTRHLASVVGDLYASVLRSAGRPLRVRIAAELLELSDSALAERDERGVATVRITHDEIATSVGSVRETVTKTVGELVRSGAIVAGYGRLRLVDPTTLLRIAQD